MICYLDDALDHDLLIRVATARGHRLISPRSINPSGKHDALHFLNAVSNKMPIITRDADDFEALHDFALGIGGHHFGLITVPDETQQRKNMAAKEIARALTNLESAGVPLADQLVVLNHYR